MTGAEYLAQFISPEAIYLAGFVSGALLVTFVWWNPFKRWSK